MNQTKASGTAAASHMSLPTASIFALPSIIDDILANDLVELVDTAAREFLDVMNALVVMVMVVKDFVE